MSLIIVVGLPASGKTTYCQELSLRHNTVFYDDCLDYLYTDMSIIDNLENGSLVILTDPRFCCVETLNNVIKYLRNSCIVFTIIAKRNPCIAIKLILFTNDPEACIHNSRSRDDKLGMINTIRRLSLSYNLDNYSEYNEIEIIPVVKH